MPFYFPVYMRICSLWCARFPFYYIHNTHHDRLFFKNERMKVGPGKKGVGVHNITGGEITIGNISFNVASFEFPSL